MSTEQLRIQSISIQVSTRTKCIGKCKGCVAAYSPNSSDSTENVELCKTRHVIKGSKFAARCGATHAIVTSKAEPLQEENWYIHGLIKMCVQHIPIIDLNTNGWLLQNGQYKIKELESCGLSMITLSISHHDPKINQNFMGGPGKSMNDVIKEARKLGILVRVSLILHDEGIRDINSLMDYIKYFGNLGVHMVVVRELWTSLTDSTFWQSKIAISDIEEQICNYFPQHGLRVTYRYSLPWEQKVYIIDGFNNPNYGVNLSFTKCNQVPEGNLVKSIVHRPDGHGYRSWGHNGDILY